MSNQEEQFVSGVVASGIKAYHSVRKRSRHRHNLDLDVSRAAFITGGGYRLLASGNFGELVLGCIEANSCHLLVAAEVP